MESSQKGSIVNCIFATPLVQSSYFLYVLELVSDCFKEVNEKVAADTTSLRAEHLDKLLPCPNPKAM